MSSSLSPTYIPAHTRLLASWTFYKHSALSPFALNLEQDLEVFRSLVIQSQNPNTLPNNREAARRALEELKRQRNRNSDDLVAKIDEMAGQMLSSLEKAEREIVSLRSGSTESDQPFGPRHGSYPIRRTHRRQGDGTYALMIRDEGTKDETGMTKKIVVAGEKVQERRLSVGTKEARGRAREERDRRREERKRGEEKGKTFKEQEGEAVKLVAGIVEMGKKYEKMCKNEKEGGNLAVGTKRVMRAVP